MTCWCCIHFRAILIQPLPQYRLIRSMNCPQCSHSVLSGLQLCPRFCYMCLKKKKTVRKMCYVLEGRHARYCSWCLYLVSLVLSIISDRDKLYKQNWRIIAVFPRKLIMSKANGPPHMNLFSPLKQGPSVCGCNDSRKIPGILLVVMFHAWWCIGDAINQL